jgi:hypothetical protein
MADISKQNWNKAIQTGGGYARFAGDPNLKFVDVSTLTPEQIARSKAIEQVYNKPTQNTNRPTRGFNLWDVLNHGFDGKYEGSPGVDEMNRDYKQTVDDYWNRKSDISGIPLLQDIPLPQELVAMSNIDPNILLQFLPRGQA